MNRIVKFSLMIFLISVACHARVLFAQISGCVDSPEDPTIFMALIGVCAAAAPKLGSRIRSLLRSR